ncbi:hypothetical protein HR13_07080 [Porphyromonas gulae]|uniref:CRISPR-associated protein Cmr3 n=2 Tax=Porphyromonas gulae TaxID=111105 RepID=A0A0A2FWM7_9PORP|nr:type III-B CRISPR module-associated protein Cmr3 [Porphyromonas gulae]KGN79499.1 hypothetical protein HR13_07080 [Porphyromonas gulae]KGN94597.1 hypothetical protein HR15_00795 [Porphyromonas gulae]
MYTYLVTLTPIEKFFFGQRNTFEDDNVNYFVRSSYFPQQTALLGLMRFQILQSAGEEVFGENKIQDKEKAQSLIGRAGFSPFPLDKKSSDFGIIEGLSPVFLMDRKNNKTYLPAGKRYQREAEEKPYTLLKLSNSNGAALFRTYSSKAKHPNMWISPDGLIKEEDFFIEDSRVGIRKNYEGGTDDKSFFYETFYRFNNEEWRELCFAFYIRLKEKRALSDKIVHLGGERQPFLMNVTPLREQTEGYNRAVAAIGYEKDPNYCTVLLLSDAYIEAAVAETAFFAVTDVREFACLLTNLETKRYYNRNKTRIQELNDKSNSDMCVSKEIELYARGSLFYFTSEKQAKEFQSKVADSHFHAIGYNHTTLISNL